MKCLIRRTEKFELHLEDNGSQGRNLNRRMELDRRVRAAISSSRVDSALRATCCGRGERGVSGAVGGHRAGIDKRQRGNISEEEVMDLGDQCMKGSGDGMGNGKSQVTGTSSSLGSQLLQLAGWRAG